MPANLADAVQEIKELQGQIAGWRRTALAMRDLAISWDHHPESSECDRIQRLYFDASMGVVFAPGDAFTHNLKDKV